MDYPEMAQVYESRNMITEFRGYNHNLRPAENEWYDMENMSGDGYPVMMPRRPRRTVWQGQVIGGITKNGKICWTDGAYFYAAEGENVNEASVSRINMGLTAGKKQLVNMGAYVVIFPDKKYINVEDTEDRGSMEAEWVANGGVMLKLCDRDGNAIEITYAQDTEPEEPENGEIWLNTDTDPSSLNRWSEGNGMWVAVATAYVQICGAAISEAFRAGDGVNVRGLEHYGIAGSQILTATDPNGGWIAVTGLPNENWKNESGVITNRVVVNDRTVAVERRVPNLDYVIESNNRLWGCRKGEARNGANVNEIYASKLGDFKNWESFAGTAEDSYVVGVGEDGPWTGAINYMGYPTFFKEDCMYRIYGSYPAEYRTQSMELRGVQPESSGSLAIVSEVLYWKATAGVMAFSGGVPVKISEALGTETFYRAAAGAKGSKYYIRMEETPKSGPTGHLFVFDTKTGMWHREDREKAEQFCTIGESLYYLSDNKIKMMGEFGDEGMIPWMVESGIIGVESPDMKKLKRLDIRMQLAPETVAEVYADYDSEDNWHKICKIVGKKLNTVTVPVRPRRCDHLRIKIKGTGDMKIYSITWKTQAGSGQNDSKSVIIGR